MHAGDAVTAAASQRQAWAVASLDIRADEQVLEIGCGHGVAATLVCARLVTGRYLGIDRSAKMIAAAARRNRQHVARGIAAFAQATFVDAALPGRYDCVFAIHVGVFLRGDPTAELARIRTHLRPAGRLCLTYQPLDPRQVTDTVERLRPVLVAHGFGSVGTVTGAVASRPIVTVVARPADAAT